MAVQSARTLKRLKLMHVTKLLNRCGGACSIRQIKGQNRGERGDLWPACSIQPTTTSMVN